MVRLNLITVISGLLLFAATSQANDLNFTVDTGEVTFVQNGTGQRVTKTDSGILNLQDSIILAADHQITLSVESNSKVLLKGPLSAVISGDASSIKISMNDGQLFLNRNEPHERSILIESNGFAFIPLGTGAAVRAVKNGNPTLAVLRGKVRMASPDGEQIVVDEGNYGSVNADGKLTSGKLNPRAVESLQNWSGVQAAQVAQAQTPQETTPLSASEPQNTQVQTPPAHPEKQQPQQKTTRQSEPKTETTPAVSPAATTQPEEINAEKTEDAATAQDKKDIEQKPASGVATAPSAPQWEIGAGSVTIDGDQWTRIALGVDVPIWKFGVFFDLELFIDNNGQFSDKGWNFKDDWVEALTRKIRYIRFGHEEEPLFIKFGGLSNVTLGYGFIFDRFTNMLHYPDQKLLGLQVYLNDIGPIGITMQTVLADFKDFRNDGGVLGARLAFTPLKMSEIPIVKGISIGGTYATDLNQYAPARDWDIKLPTTVRQLNYLYSLNNDSSRSIDTIIAWGGNDPREDYADYQKEKIVQKTEDPYKLIGFDIGIPLIRSSILKLDLYGQSGFDFDDFSNWGIGAPGLSLKVWQLWASIEYRHTEGKFTPGYFDAYYLDERLLREPIASTKEDRLIDNSLNGIFGRLGFNIANALIIDGSYQYLIGKSDDKDQRFEATASIGDLILGKIPKLNKAEAYYCKSNIGTQNDRFWEKTEFMYVGYRAGFEISQGASLIWDSRYGYKHDQDGKLVSDNFISVQTAITF